MQKVKMSFELHSLGKNDATKGKPQAEKYRRMRKSARFNRVCQNPDRISNFAIFDTSDCWADRYYGGEFYISNFSGFFDQNSELSIDTNDITYLIYKLEVSIAILNENDNLKIG